MSSIRPLTTILAALTLSCFAACAQESETPPAPIVEDGPNNDPNDPPEEDPVDPPEEDPVDPPATPEERLSCVGELEQRDIVRDEATFTGTATSINGSALEGVQVRACHLIDRECQEPVTEATSDADGLFSLVLPVGGIGFDGYLEMRREGLRDTLVFFPNPIVEDAAQMVLMSEAGIWRLSMDTVGVVEDTERGAVASIVRDCDKAAIGGVTLSVSSGDADTSIFYTALGLPSSGAQFTESNGLALAYNVPDGSVSLTATHDGAGVRIARQGVFVRKGFITQMNLEPRHPFSSDWSCLGEVELVETPVDTIERVTRVVDLLSGDPLEGVRVRVCAGDDINCDNPLDEAISDANGRYSISLPNDSGAGFTGYTEYTGEGIRSTLIYINVNNRLTRLTPTNLNLLSHSTLASLASAAGTELDESRGTLGVDARDCANHRAEGVEFSASTADDASKVFYFRSGFPSRDATNTDSSGLGTVANLPVGQTTLEARFSGEDGAYTRFDVIIRPGFLTNVILHPAE